MLAFRRNLRRARPALETWQASQWGQRKEPCPQEVRWDLPSMYEPYLPGPVRGVARLYNKAVYRIGSPHLMGHITFRATMGPGLASTEPEQRLA